jgi:hypothetical protein
LQTAAIVVQVAAEKNAYDVGFTIFGAGVSTDWSPELLQNQRVALADRVFQGEAQRKFSDRAETVRKGFGDFFARHAQGLNSCTSVAQAANRLANESHVLNVLVIGTAICSQPRVTLRMPPERRLVIVLSPTAREDDCSLAARQQQARRVFPGATVVLAPLTHDTMTRPAKTLNANLTVTGCESAPAKPRAEVAAVEPRPVEIDFPTSPAPQRALRLISPRHGSGSGLDLPFQGEGASPGDWVYPVVRVRDEYFPNDPVRADSFGRYNGVVRIGRRVRDCNESYELRVFSKLHRPLSVNHPEGAWPSAEASSLPVAITRDRECEACPRCGN